MNDKVTVEKLRTATKATNPYLQAIDDAIEESRANLNCLENLRGVVAATLSAGTGQVVPLSLDAEDLAVEKKTGG